MQITLRIKSINASCGSTNYFISTKIPTRIMQETIMLDAIERYIRGEMLPEERVFFEELRKSNPAVDQMVVEHTLFLQEMSAYGEQKNFRAQLNEMHKGLVTTGEIK